jgi:hypothetical protein
MNAAAPILWHPRAGRLAAVNVTLYDALLPVLKVVGDSARYLAHSAGS